MINLRERINEIRRDENNLRFYFYTNEGILVKPEMRESFFENLIDVQVGALINFLSGHEAIEEFDLDGNLDSELACWNLESNSIDRYTTIKNKLINDDYEMLEESQISDFYDNIRAIVIVINDNLTLIKKFSYPKRLIKNSIIKFKKYPLEQVEDDIFSIDNRVDLFEIDNKIYILSNYFFETIFDLTSEYQNKVNQSREILENSNLLNNENSFIDDCLKGKRNTKKLLKLINKNNFENVKDNFEEVKRVIDEYDLSITLADNTINYSHGDSVPQILDLIGDNYYISRILSEKRLAKANKKYTA